MTLRYAQDTVPMSTASAVLRPGQNFSFLSLKKGTYVYRFGGIETFVLAESYLLVLVVPMSTASAVLRLQLSSL